MPVKELIQYIAKGLVDYHHDISVCEIESPHPTVIELKVAKAKSIDEKLKIFKSRLAFLEQERHSEIEEMKNPTANY